MPALEGEATELSLMKSERIKRRSKIFTDFYKKLKKPIDIPVGGRNIIPLDLEIR